MTNFYQNLNSLKEKNLLSTFTPRSLVPRNMKPKSPNPGLVPLSQRILQHTWEICQTTKKILKNSQKKNFKQKLATNFQKIFKKLRVWSTKFLMSQRFLMLIFVLRGVDYPGKYLSSALLLIRAKMKKYYSCYPIIADPLIANFSE